MVSKNKNINVKEAATYFGRLGGKALYKKRGKAHMRKLGKRSARVRWQSKDII